MRGEGRRPVNASLILFAKMATQTAVVGRRMADGMVRWRFRESGCGVMRNVLILAAFMAGLGTIMAQMADRMTTSTALARSAPARAETSETAGQVGLRSLSIPSDSRGHFQTEGRIEGQRIGFMVDTGASVIALNETSAARFGLRPSRNDYNAVVTTANGTIRAARTQLARVEVGGLVVRNVEAMVLPDQALSENLLGLSFLSRLKRFEYANGRMVLEQ